MLPCPTANCLDRRDTSPRCLWELCIKALIHAFGPPTQTHASKVARHHAFPISPEGNLRLGPLERARLEFRFHLGARQPSMLKTKQRHRPRRPSTLRSAYRQRLCVSLDVSALSALMEGPPIRCHAFEISGNHPIAWNGYGHDPKCAGHIRGAIFQFFGRLRSTPIPFGRCRKNL